MSERKTDVFFISISSDIFKNIDEAIKEANSIKVFIQRLCTKKDYACKAIIGISENNPKTGHVDKEKSGKSGRPPIIFKMTKNFMVPMKTKPHLHIIIYGYPARTISKIIADHLNKKYKKKVDWTEQCQEKDHVNNVVQYVLNQSIKLRAVSFDRHGLLNNDDCGFYEAINKANEILEMNRVKFTFPVEGKAYKNLDMSNDTNNLSNDETLVCNTSTSTNTNTSAMIDNNISLKDNTKKYISLIISETYNKSVLVKETSIFDFSNREMVPP